MLIFGLHIQKRRRKRKKKLYMILYMSQLNILQKIISLFSSEPEDRHELLELLRESETRNLLDHDALTMIEGALQVSEMQVRDVMVPRSQMVVINEDDTPEAFLPLMVESALNTI